MSLSKGFTLIELLVVISIIAILSVIGLVYYSGIQQKARDSTRKADIAAITNALEINKTPISYVPLQESQFTSFPEKDPLGYAYCIGVGSPANPEVESSWGNECPAGFNAVSSGQPTGVFNEWKVCAFLEAPEPNTSNLFCRSQAQ